MTANDITAEVPGLFLCKKCCSKVSDVVLQPSITALLDNEELLN